jgi:hypothetical protein
VLSAFVATFAYSAAGLYTVGVSGGNRTAAFPRLAVSGRGRYCRVPPGTARACACGSGWASM